MSHVPFSLWKALANDPLLCIVFLKWSCYPAVLILDSLGMPGLISKARDYSGESTIVLQARAMLASLGAAAPQPCVATARRALTAGMLPTSRDEHGESAASLIRLGASVSPTSWLKLAALARRWAAEDEQSNRNREGISEAKQCQISPFFRAVATADSANGSLPSSVATAGMSGLSVTLMAAMWPLRAGSVNPLRDGAGSSGGDSRANARARATGKDASIAMEDGEDDEDEDEDEDQDKVEDEGTGATGGASSVPEHDAAIPPEALSRALAAAAAALAMVPLRGARAAGAT